jgi:hypothetical protein
MQWADIKEKLVADVRSRKLRQTARELGWHYTKLHRLASGHTEHPRIDTVEELANFYSRREAEH